MSFFTPSLAQLPLAPLAQSPAFGAALTHIGRPPLRLSLRGGRGEVQIIRRHFGPLSVGLVSRFDLPRRDLQRLAREAEVRLLILNPESSAGAHGMALQTPAHVAELDIAGSDEALRAALKQKWRNRLSKAERAGLEVSERALDPDADHALFAHEAEQARAQGYANWPEALIRAYGRANRGQVRVFEARHAGAVIASMVFLCHGAVATYHMGWSDPAGRAHSAHHLLLWQAMRALRGRGAQRLDLGSVATDRAPGLARFKLGTGARARALGGTWAVLPALTRQWRS